MHEITSNGSRLASRRSDDVQTARPRTDGQFREQDERAVRRPSGAIAEVRNAFGLPAACRDDIEPAAVPP